MIFRSGRGSRRNLRKGQKVGDGKVVLISSAPKQGVYYDLSFTKGKYNSKGALTMQPAAGGTKVTWTDDGELGRNPVNRFFGLMMDRLIGPDLEAGLAKQKLQAEKNGK